MSREQPQNDQGKRIGIAVERMLKNIRAPFPFRNNKFVFQFISTRNVPDYFQIAEKADPGQRYPDGTNWRTYRGPSWKQLTMMEQTSATDEELAERIRAFVMDGVDTTRPVVEQPTQQVSPYNDDLISKLVAEKVADILRDKVALMQLARGQRAPEEVAVAEPRKPREKLPAGEHERKRFANRKRVNEQEIQLVKDRCAILGIPESQIHWLAGGTVISKIFLRKLNEQWKRYNDDQMKKAGAAAQAARAAVNGTTEPSGQNEPQA